MLTKTARWPRRCARSCSFRGALLVQTDILCVGDPSFESSGGIIIVDGELGRQFVESLRDDVSHMLLVK